MTAPTTDRTAGTLVIENEALRKGFTIIPNYVLRNPALSFGARLTYTLLLSYAWQEGACFPGQDKLAADLQTDPRTIRRYLETLKESGLIKIKQRGLGQTNVYILTDLSSGPSFEADRTQLSGLERTQMSGLDRTVVSAKEDSERRKLKTGNRLAVEKTTGEAGSRGLASLSTLIKSRTVPSRTKQILDKKQEIAPLAEAAAERLEAPQSLGMFFKVLLQLYPEHHHLFDQAVAEAAAAPKPRVSRSALFAHIIQRLARENSVPLRLGPRGDHASKAAPGPPD